VILEICDIQNQIKISEIAKSLGITPIKAAQAVKRLLKLGLLIKDSGGLKPASSHSQFGDEVPSEAIVSFHSQILEQAQKALRELPMRSRESQSIVFSLNEKDIPQLQSEMRKAIYNIVNKYAVDANKNCVQAVSLQIFPLWSKKGVVS
jgi:uncharacterized protein (TIGR02147 family)